MVDLSRILYSFLGTGFEGQPNVFPTQLKANGSLDFPHDLIIGDSLPTFILCNDLWLLVNFSSQIFLGEALILPALLDHFAHFKWHSLVAELLRLSVQLGCVFGYNMLFILPSSPFLRRFHSFSLSLSSSHSLKTEVITLLCKPKLHVDL